MVIVIVIKIFYNNDINEDKITKRKKCYNYYGYSYKNIL